LVDKAKTTQVEHRAALDKLVHEWTFGNDPGAPNQMHVLVQGDEGRFVLWGLVDGVVEERDEHLVP